MNYFADDVFMNDDASSQSSMNSFKYSNFNYCDKDDHDPILAVGGEHRCCTPQATNKFTRFCPREEIEANFITKQLSNLRMDACRCSGGSRHRCPRLTRMRSYVDVRSQQLQRSLMEEIHKRRMFKTVGAIENIGFQQPNADRNYVNKQALLNKDACFSR